MSELPPIVVTALTGLVTGLLISIPVGPINLTIINEGGRRGFLWGFLIGLGAVTMDTVYCTLAFTGFASFFERGVIKAAMDLTSFVFLLYLGHKFVTVRAIEAPGKIEARLEEKLHPRSAYATGFVRVMGNPGLLLAWIIIAAKFTSRELVEPDMFSRFTCVGGIATGATVWFLLLSYAVSVGSKKIGEKTLLRLERFSGVCLIGAAAYNGAKIVTEMLPHSHHLHRF
jgi:threonine/homoserine/homoserine lactone efflux protein